MRAVLDTTVLISGVTATGVPHELLGSGFDLDLADVYCALAYDDSTEATTEGRDRRDRRVRESREEQPSPESFGDRRFFFH